MANAIRYGPGTFAGLILGATAAFASLCDNVARFAVAVRECIAAIGRWLAALPFLPLLDLGAAPRTLGLIPARAYERRRLERLPYHDLSAGCGLRLAV